MGHAGKGFCEKGMIGEPVVPAKKKKQVCDVCGAPTKLASENKSTRPKRKSKFVTCAEHPASKRQRTKVPAKKKKKVCDVCGAPSPPEPENQSTRPKRKSKYVTCAERPAS